MQPRLIMSWKKAREVNPGVEVNLWLVNLWVNLSMEQSALSEWVNLSMEQSALSDQLTRT